MPRPHRPRTPRQREPPVTQAAATRAPVTQVLGRGTMSRVAREGCRGRGRASRRGRRRGSRLERRGVPGPTRRTPSMCRPAIWFCTCSRSSAAATASTPPPRRPHATARPETRSWSSTTQGTLSTSAPDRGGHTDPRFRRAPHARLMHVSPRSPSASGHAWSFTQQHVIVVIGCRRRASAKRPPPHSATVEPATTPAGPNGTTCTSRRQLGDRAGPEPPAVAALHLDQLTAAESDGVAQHEQGPGNPAEIDDNIDASGDVVDGRA